MGWMAMLWMRIASERRRASDAPGQRQRFQPAENLRAVIEKDAVNAVGFERGPIQFAAGLHH